MGAGTEARSGKDRDGGEWTGDACELVDNLIMYAMVVEDDVGSGCQSDA
jgi:hypothetical protein